MQSKNKIFLIGKNLSNSLSYKIHGAIYDYLGLDLIYHLFYQNADIHDEHALDDFLSAHSDDALFVSNVTYPYKKAVYDTVLIDAEYCDEATKFAGGCNFVCLAPKRELCNFDGFGCVKFLKLEGYGIEGENIVICGTGITAKSIAYACHKNLAASVVMLTRQDDDKVGDPKIVNYKNSDELLADADILIDATPLSFGDVPVIDIKKLNRSAIVIDLVYADQDTPIIADAKNSGHMAFDGKGILISQAVLSIQEICKLIKFDNIKVKDFEKLYKIGAEAINY